MPIRLKFPLLSPLVANRHIAKVIDNSQAQTVIVSLDRYGTDERYNVLHRKVQTLWCHDEEDVCNVGDIVTIQKMQPKISERKDYLITSILRRENIYDEQAYMTAKQELLNQQNQLASTVPFPYKSIIPFMTPNPVSHAQTSYQYRRRWRRPQMAGTPFQNEVYPPPFPRFKLSPHPRGTWLHYCSKFKIKGWYE